MTLNRLTNLSKAEGSRPLARCGKRKPDSASTSWST